MHATTLELEDYVAGLLEPVRASQLDRHVEACVECARALLGEARLEVAVRAVAAELRCGMRADAVEPAQAEVEEPVVAPWRGRFAFAAVAAVVLAFAAAHLPRAPGVASAPAVLLTDAGDFSAAHGAPADWATGDVSGGTP